jgi:hypothetical protein
MKKIFNIAFMIAFASLAMISCKKESLKYEGPVLAHFNGVEGSYFVDEAGEEFSIPIGITKPNDADVTVTIKVNTEESSAVEGEDFTFQSKEITFKAGEVLSDLVVLGNFEGLDEPKTIVLEIESSDKSAQFNQTYTLDIQRFCPFVRDDFVGLYAFGSEWWFSDDNGPLLDDEGNPITEEVEAIADPEDENAIIFLDLYEPGFNIKVVLNASDKSNFVTSVAKQDAWIYPGIGTIFLVGGSGKFSACDKTLSYETKHGLPDGRFFTGVELALFTKLD